MATRVGEKRGAPGIITASPDMNYPFYPRQPDYNPECGVNQKYKTIPQEWPREKVVASPASMKRIYTGVPNHYPYAYNYRPVGTMYEQDLSQFGPQGKRETYHYKVYPFTHRHAREVNEQARVIPYDGIEAWTKHPVVRDSVLAGQRGQVR